MNPIAAGEITTDGKNIFVTWPGNSSRFTAYYNIITGIDTACWNKEGSKWIVAPERVHAVLKAFPDFKVDAGIKNVIKAMEYLETQKREEADIEQQRVSMQVQALMANLPDLTKQLPDGRTPRLHQQTGVPWLIKNPYSILGDDPGTGKTLTSLLAATAFKLPIIVIVTKNAHENWLREAAKLAHLGCRVSVHSNGSIPPPPSWTEYVLIGDESHKFKTWGEYYLDRETGQEKIRGTQRTAKFIRLARHENCRAAYLLTGTPIPNGLPKELFPLLYAIKWWLANDKKAYEKYYCAAGPKKVSRTKTVQWDINGAAHLDELCKNFKPIFLRRRQSECGDLPSLQISEHTVEVTSEVQKTFVERFTKLRESYLQRLRDGEIKEGGDALVALGQLMTASAISKIAAAVELSREILGINDQNLRLPGEDDNKNQVILFTYKVEVAKEVARQLGVEFITGEIKDRQAVVDRFQEGKKRAVVCTYQAAGEAMNMQAGNYEILIDPPWVPSDITQAHGRFKRDGSHHKSLFAYHLFLPVVEVPGLSEPVRIDEKIYGALNQKIERIEKVLEGTRKTMRGIKHLGDIAKEILDDLYQV